MTTGRGVQDSGLDASGRRRTLVVASAGTLLVLMTFVTPLATGVRTAADLGTGPAAVAWLLSAMSVGLAAALLTAGVVGDARGRRRVFAVGLLVVGLGAATAAAAPSSAVFVGARVGQGVGAAAVLACALGLVGHAYPPGPDRSRAAAVWGASVGAGTGLGGLLAVLVDRGDGWRVTYAVTAGLSVALAAVARAVLTESADGVHRRLDLLGAALLAAGLGGLLTGLVQSRAGWAHPSVAVPLLGGAALLAGFVAVEARVTDPMIDLALFRVHGFTAATVGAVVSGVAVIGVTSYLPTVMQTGLGDSLLAATLLVFVWSATSTVTALGVRWISAVDGRLLLAASLAVSAAGLVTMSGLSPDSTPQRLLPGLVVLGVGYGAANAALGREAVAHVPTGRAAMGSGANNTARYLGAALGVTLVVLVASSSGPVTAPAELMSGWNQAALAGAVASALGALAVALIRPRRRATDPAPP